MRFLEENKRREMDYCTIILFNSFSTVFDNIRKIYMKHDNEPSAAERKVLCRENKFNRAKSEILTLLKHNANDPHCLSNRINDVSLSPKAKVVKDHIKNIISQAQKIDLNNIKASSLNYSQSLSSMQTNLTNRTNKSSQSSNLIDQAPKTDAYEKKKEEMFDTLIFHRQKTKDKIQQFKKKLDLYGVID